VFWVWYFQSPGISQSKGVERYDINLPEDIPLSFIGSAHFGVGQTALAISPDGELLVYAGQIDKTTRLFIRHMDSYEVSELKGTDGAYFPFFSPTGKWIGFFSNGYLKKIPITGSGSITLCQVTNPSGAVWSNDDRIIFANDEGTVLDWIRAEGGEINNLLVEEATGAFGSLSFPSTLNEEFILVSSQWPTGIFAISLENGRQFRLTNQGKSPHYLPSGHLSFIDYGRLMVVPFDISNMKSSGEVISVIEGLRTEESTGQVTLSSKGDLIYVPGISAIESELVLCSLDGIEEKLILKSDYYGQFNNPYMDPPFESLRIDPRWQKMFDKVGFPK
jgi:serine/threonine-protein kinase